MLTTLGLLSLVVATSASNVPRNLVTDPAAFAQTTFDYIVVGGGTAGLPVAARLAENPNIKVGLIETGEYRPNDPLIDTPAFYGRTIGNPNYDWGYSTTPQSDLNGRSLLSPRGKVLGGSSAINFLALMRASAADYDSWAELGNWGWGWWGLLPSFKKSEKYFAPPLGSDAIFPGVSVTDEAKARLLQPVYRGDNGPLQVTPNEIYTAALKPFVRALNALGIKTNRSPEYGDATGVWNTGTAVDRPTGKRSYAASTYFANNANKANFVVLTGAQATKVVFSSTKDSQGRVTATGVQFVAGSSNTTYTVNASREVILSAGAYNSPQLLELSGIGNPSIINPLGIETVVDLPGVGENLQDHLYVPSDFIAKPGTFTFDALRINATYAAEQQARYEANHDGAYAATISAFSFFTLDQFLPADEVAQMKAELDAELAATESTQTPLQKAQYAIQKRWLNENIGNVEIILIPNAFATNPPAADTSYVSLLSAIHHPFSRGSVHISSANPLALATLNPRFLSSAFDLKCLVKTTEFIRKVANTEPLKSILDGPITPPASVSTYEQFEEYVKNVVQPVYHPIGTVALAPRNLGGVVDPKLVVYGTKNLRVADASVAPLHIATHTAHTAYAIGEKAAELIKNDQ